MLLRSSIGATRHCPRSSLADLPHPARRFAPAKLPPSSPDDKSDPLRYLARLTARSAPTHSATRQPIILFHGIEADIMASIIDLQTFGIVICVL
ncbi:unnamed protein product [Citrullus colocynthis]|uniref:Uncharacterized protein n=1 Tax=Citrullus colocynthis TaxID=252529 RepID=A0ABP0YZR4_9ROSI